MSFRLSKMSVQSKPQRSSMRRSLDVPMSAFNKQLLEEAGKLSASNDRVSRGYLDGSTGSRRMVCLISLFLDCPRQEMFLFATIVLIRPFSKHTAEVPPRAQSLDMDPQEGQCSSVSEEA